MPPSLEAVLDHVDGRLAPEHAIGAMHDLALALRCGRQAASEEGWGAFRRAARMHPLARRLLEDPLTDRALAKPRGYAGDAVAIDYVYAGLPVAGVQRTTRLGRAIFAYTAGCSAPAVAIRQRRNTLSLAIDETAATVRGARVMAVGAGHLREARLSRAVSAGSLGAFVAVDGDRESLRVIDREYGSRGVNVVQASAADLSAGRVQLGAFDLVYAAGLYERLGDVEARALTGALLRSLAPGGRLLLSSFVDGFLEQEYMQTFMDWRLECRDEAAMLALVESLSPSARGASRAWRDATGCMAWLQVTRPGASGR
jgi:SAM-dependent methyltransferase